MSYLVTGASGFLGSNLVRKLVADGKSVVALVRPTSNLRRLEDAITKIELRISTLQDYESLYKALDGIDCVLHLAANVRIGSFKKKQMQLDNVEGCRNLFRAALGRKTKKVVYVSSISIFGSDIEDLIKEDDVGKGRIMTTYGETKLASYYLFKNAYNSGLDVTAVIPSNIFGADDPNFGPLFKNYVQRHLRVIAGNLDANMGMIYVDDVCDGIMLAMEKGKAGESYILNAYNITLKNLFQEAERFTGIKAPRVKIPRPIVKGAAIFSEIAGRIIRQQMLLNRQSAELLFTTHPRFDSSKARNELGWDPALFKKTFAQTLDWYVDKYVKKKKKR